MIKSIQQRSYLGSFAPTDLLADWNVDVSGLVVRVSDS